ncbi:MAG: hypothetical protein LBK18_08875 [Prevotellaceae bacterium]|jgi:hypothetical protein|nr:hypothetical protein [Prevotellaceae bacterium]
MNMHDNPQQAAPLPLSIEDVKKKIAPIFDVRIPQRDATFPIYAKQSCGDKYYSCYWYFVFLNCQDCLWITSDAMHVMNNRDDFYRNFLEAKNASKETREVTSDEFFKYVASPFFKRVQRHVAGASGVWLNEFLGNFYFENDKDDLLFVSKNEIKLFANSNKFLEEYKTQQGLFVVRRVDSEELLQRSAELLQEHIARFVRLASPPAAFDKKVTPARSKQNRFRL